MKNLINLYRKRPTYTFACIALSIVMVAMAAIFVSPWLGALLLVAAVVLLDDCGEVAE